MLLEGHDMSVIRGIDDMLDEMQSLVDDQLACFKKELSQQESEKSDFSQESELKSGSHNEVSEHAS